MYIAILGGDQIYLKIAASSLIETGGVEPTRGHGASIITGVMDLEDWE